MGLRYYGNPERSVSVSTVCERIFSETSLLDSYFSCEVALAIEMAIANAEYVKRTILNFLHLTIESVVYKYHLTAILRSQKFKFLIWYLSWSCDRI